MPNGVGVVVYAPPADMSPVVKPYGTSIGASEFVPTPGAEVPAILLVEGGASFQGAYAFQEFALECDNNSVQVIDLTGQTIDWPASELAQEGSIDFQFGVQTYYQLVGKPYTERQYTFLRLVIGLEEDGVTKPNAWVVRMKHF